MLFGTLAGFCLYIFKSSQQVGHKKFISLLIWVKTGQKVVTAEEVLVAKGKNLVANATDTLALSSPVLIRSSWWTNKLKLDIGTLAPGFCSRNTMR